MAATIMSAEFGTIHYYPSLAKYSEVCLCSSLDGHLRARGKVQDS